MKKIILAVLLFIPALAFSQNIEQRQFQLAQSYERSGDLKSAESIYEQLTNSNKTNQTYIDGYVRVLGQQNKYNDLLEFLEERIKLVPNFINYAYLAQTYWLKGDIAKANETWPKALELAKTQDDYLLISQAFISFKLYDRARDVLLVGRKKLNSKNMFSEELVKVYTLLGDYQNSFDEIINNLLTTQNLALAQGQLYALMLNENAKPIIESTLNRALSTSNENPYILYLYSWYARNIGDFDKALEITLKIDKLYNSNYAEVLRFANTSNTDGQYDIAIKAYSLIIEQGKKNANTPSALYGFARALEQKFLADKKLSDDNIKQLISIYNQIIKDYPNTQQESDAYISLANIYANYLHDNKKAIEYLSKIQQKRGLANKYLDAQLQLADLYLKEKNIDKSIDIYKNIINLSEQTRQSEYSIYINQAKFNIAKCYYYQGKIDTAKSILAEIQADPQSDVANDVLELSSFIAENENMIMALKTYSEAEYLEFQGSTEEAIAKYEQASKLGKGGDLEERSLLNIANIYLQSGQYQKAIEEYNAILDQFLNSINKDLIYFNIGKAYMLDNQDERAITNFTKVLVEYPKSIYYEEARKFIRQLRDKKEKS
jgi:tetratricopeptide (TPR) repeat protein